MDVWAALIEDAIQFGRPLEKTDVFGFLRVNGSGKGFVAYFNKTTGQLQQAHLITGRSFWVAMQRADAWWSANMTGK
jgi:hypothetical protein